MEDNDEPQSLTSTQPSNDSSADIISPTSSLSSSSLPSDQHHGTEHTAPPQSPPAVEEDKKEEEEAEGKAVANSVNTLSQAMEDTEQSVSSQQQSLNGTVHEGTSPPELIATATSSGSSNGHVGDTVTEKEREKERETDIEEYRIEFSSSVNSSRSEETTPVLTGEAVDQQGKGGMDHQKGTQESSQSSAGLSKESLNLSDASSNDSSLQSEPHPPSRLNILEEFRAATEEEGVDFTGINYLGSSTVDAPVSETEANRKMSVLKTQAGQPIPIILSVPHHNGGSIVLRDPQSNQTMVAFLVRHVLFCARGHVASELRDCFAINVLHKRSGVYNCHVFQCAVPDAVSVGGARMRGKCVSGWVNERVIVW